MAKNAGTVYVAIETGSAEINGETFPFVRGITRVREGHPLLKGGRMQFFVPAEEHVHYEWEAATAAPGEKRGG
jgi:hypothetical protein